MPLMTKTMRRSCEGKPLMLHKHWWISEHRDPNRSRKNSRQIRVIMYTFHNILCCKAELESRFIQYEVNSLHRQVLPLTSHLPRTCAGCEGRDWPSGDGIAVHPQSIRDTRPEGSGSGEFHGLVSISGCNSHFFTSPFLGLRGPPSALNSEHTICVFRCLSVPGMLEGRVFRIWFSFSHLTASGQSSGFQSSPQGCVHEVFQATHRNQHRLSPRH